MFFPAMERTKDRRGTPSMSAFAQRALIGGFSSVPLFYGSTLLRGWHLHPAGKMWSAFSLLPRGHKPLPGLKFQRVRAIRTPPAWAKPGQVGSRHGRIISARPITVPPEKRQGVGGVRESCPPVKFRLAGPKAREEKVAWSKLRTAGTYCPLSVARPRKWGSRGRRLWTPAFGEVSIEGSPLAHLWFLSVRAERDTRPPKNKKVIHMFLKLCGQETGT